MSPADGLTILDPVVRTFSYRPIKFPGKRLATLRFFIVLLKMFQLGCLPLKRGSWRNITLRTARRRTICSKWATTRKWCGRQRTKSVVVSPNARTGRTNGRANEPAAGQPNTQNIFTTTSVTTAQCESFGFICLFCFVTSIAT